jgi:hypothetical protein
MRMRSHRSDAMRAVDRARRLARRAAIDVAIEDGAQAISRPAYPGAGHEIRDVEPMAGFRAAHEIEVGARYTARRYLQDAREAGFTWHDIGMAMDAGMRRESERAGGSAAELAYQYAVERAGRPGPYYDTAFSWTCQSCDKLIIDRGPFNTPAADQQGHAADCERLARAEADWDADWEAAD